MGFLQSVLSHTNILDKKNGSKCCNLLASQLPNSYTQDLGKYKDRDKHRDSYSDRYRKGMAEIWKAVLNQQTVYKLT